MKRIISDFDLDSKRVIIRCDFNVPIENDKITDDNRIIQSLKTINYAIDNNAKVILLSHLGRIKDENDKAKYSLLPVAKRLEELLERKVTFIDETRGSVLEETLSNMKNQDVVLMQNTRYEDYPDKRESNCDLELSKYWASFGDVFINDAFGCSHRSCASIVGIAKYLPSGIGFLIEKEINMLGSTLNDPKRPYVVIMGGAKMNDKIRVIDRLVEKCDYLLLAGGIANTFLVAKGYDLKDSVYDEESVGHAKSLMDKYEDKIVLPVDGYASERYMDNLPVSYCDLTSVPDGMMVLDVGPKTILLFFKYVNNCKTLFLNGPVGVCEFKNFEYGTKSLFELLKKSGADVIVGGGDSAAAAIKFGYKDAFYHISTGGGASLEFIEGKELPGIAIVDDK